MLLQYPVFIGAFPFSQDLEFDLKQFQRVTENQNPMELDWTRSRGCYVNSPRNVEKKRFKSWTHKKGGPQNLGIGSRFGFSWGGSALVKLGSWNMGGAVVIFAGW